MGSDMRFSFFGTLQVTCSLLVVSSMFFRESFALGFSNVLVKTKKYHHNKPLKICRNLSAVELNLRHCLLSTPHDANDVISAQLQVLILDTTYRKSFFLYNFVVSLI